MILLIFRTFMIYFIIMASMRLMGKRQLGELQPSELVSTILISNLASIPIESPDIPLLSGIIPVLLLVSLEVLVSAVSARNRKVETAVSGSAQILIQNGKIDQRVMNELRFSADDLLCALRLKDVFSVEDVALCMVETNGSISVCKTQQPPAPPPMPVVVSGCFDQAALSACKIDQGKVVRILKQNGLLVQDVLLMFYDEKGQAQIIQKENV